MTAGELAKGMLLHDLYGFLITVGTIAAVFAVGLVIYIADRIYMWRRTHTKRGRP